MIYLDNNATTPLLPEVYEAMKPYFLEQWGNPSSTYKFGSSLKTVIQKARNEVAELINASPLEILFTSSATESNNAAINSAIKTNIDKKHIITSAVEHSSVLSYCKYLEHYGYTVTYLPVDREGLLNLDYLRDTIKEETAVVSLMWANNETGVLFPINEISEICQTHGVLFHCDAVQAVGKIDIDLKSVQIDYLSLSAHKFHGPKGIGALYVKKKTPFIPLIIGGHQEKNMRGGTENVPLIVGIGKAASIAKNKIGIFEGKIRTLRDALEESIIANIKNAELNGHKTLRIANTSNISFHNVEAESLLILLDQEGICASSGAACLADLNDSSHVITAMKKDIQQRNSIRFSLGEDISQNIIKTIVSILSEKIELLLP